MPSSSALAEIYVCTDFLHVSPAAISFVGKQLGVRHDVSVIADIEAALEAHSGTLFISTHAMPSLYIERCVAGAEQLTPGAARDFGDAVSRLGSPPSPDVMEILLRPFPADEHEALKRSFGPTLSSGSLTRSGPWTTHVVTTILDEPTRSLQAIEGILNSDGQCALSFECSDAFAAFIGER